MLWKTLVLDLTGSTDLVPLVIDLPRNILDSKSGNLDSDFVVLVNGEPIEYQEVTTSDTTRQLSIVTTPGHRDVQIEIIGNTVVPEFGTITMFVLIFAIVGIIIFSTKFGLLNKTLLKVWAIYFHISRIIFLHSVKNNK